MNVFPTETLQVTVPELLANDSTYLAAAAAVTVFLIADPFSPGFDTDLTALTLASFTGSTAKGAGIGTQTVFFDPLTGERVIQLKEPAGGWTWIATAAPASPQTIYGICVTDNAGVVTLASGLLPEPVVITNIGDAVVVGTIQFRFPGQIFVA